MAAAMTSKSICSMCSPKQVLAIASCKGCLKDLCRKHFNEHRDELSKNLYNVFEHRDHLLQELQIKIDQTSIPLDNDNARVILKQVDEWERTTIERVSQAANEVRANGERLFSTNIEYDRLKLQMDKITNELQEQQQSESFVETDIDHWMKQLEQLRIGLNRPATLQTNPPVLQIQNVDWNTIIKIASPFEEYRQETGMLYPIAIEYS
jgi:small-conductance mechanosensitive channel